MSVTKLQIITKVEADLDLQEETFITATEMATYLNDAIRDARAVLLNVDPDYFLTPVAFPIVTGTKDYDLPAGIYASKIRALEYDNGTKQYEIKRIRNYHKFIRMAMYSLYTGPDTMYKYTLLKKATGDSFTLRLVPGAFETTSTFVTMWYERESNVLAIDADILDIPEHVNFIYSHMKKSCKTKMNNMVVPPDAQAELDREEARMIESLGQMVEDDDTELEGDFSIYEEHS